MKKIISFAANQPWLVLISLALVSYLASTQLHKLEFNISAKSMMVENDPDLDYYNRILKVFGDDNLTILYFQDEQLFNKDKLAAIETVIDELRALPYVTHVESLFSINHIKSVDGEISSAPYLATLPETDEMAAQIKRDALLNPFIEKNLLSASGHAMAVNILYQDAGDDGSLEERIANEIDLIIQPLESELETVFQIGSPYVRKAITERIYEDMGIILPLSMLVLLVTLGFVTKRLTGVVIPFFTASLSVTWTLGLMAFFGVPVNVMTSIVPALLVIIGSTEDIHLLSEFYAGKSVGLNKKQAISGMAKNMGAAVTLTFITTYLGFLSIALNNIDLLRQFGLVASSGLLFNFLITVLFVPASLSLFGGGEEPQRPTELTAFQRFIGGIFEAVQNNKNTVVVVAVLIAVIASFSALSLRVNNTTLDYFDQDSPISLRVNQIQESLSGMKTYSIVLESGIEGTFQKVRYLEEIKKIQDFLIQSGFADKTLSFVDYLSLMHVTIEEDTSGDLYLPTEDTIVSEYMNFISQEQVKSFVSPEFDQARILVRHQLESSYDLDQSLQKVRRYVEGNIDPGLIVRVTGKSVLASKAADYMASAQAQSLVLMIFVILAIISLLFVSLKAGLLAVIPNVFPIIILFGVMGFADIPLNTGTAMTAAIALGICVDDTMHFMVRYHELTQHEQDRSMVLPHTVRDEAVPIMSTSIALALGFSAMAASNFPPVSDFGLLSAMVMFLALISTFILTPVLLSYVSLITVWDLLSLELKSQVIQKCSLFEGMSQFQIRRAVLLSGVREYQAGDCIIRQGDLSNEMYVLLDGAADIQQTDRTGSKNTLGVLVPGDVFGEIALVSKMARTADIVATSPVRVLSLNWESFRRVARIYPRVATRLYQNISNILGQRMAHLTNAELFIHDELSGALKKDVFNTFLSREVNSALRYKEALSLLMFEVTTLDDNGRPSRINDDAIVSTLITQIVHTARTIDVFARWDGNVFALLMPKTGYSQAKIVVKRFRDGIASLSATPGGRVVFLARLAEIEENESADDFVQRTEDSPQYAGNQKA